MDIALLAEGTYPYHAGGVSVWCDQLVRGLAPNRFYLHTIIGGADETPTWELPDNVISLNPVELWGPTPRTRLSARDSAELLSAFEQFARSLVDPTGEQSFLDSLHKLFVLSRQTQLVGALRSKKALGILLEAMRAADLGDRTLASDPTPVTVADAMVALELIEHQIRPLFAPAPEADLCHATANGLAVLLALGAYWTRKTPLVLSEHGIYLRERYLAFSHKHYSSAVRSIMLRFFKRLTWAGYQIADAIAPGSEYNRQWLETVGAAPDRINPIYNGVDPAEFAASPTEPEVPTLVWLGRIDPLKDVETLIRTFAKVQEALPECRLRIFGGTTTENEPYRERCVALRDELGLQESAIFEGRAESVLEVYHAGHVVLLTSISEGFPYTLIEAMASGKPTVSTDVGGVREASGDAGLVVPPQNPEKMAAACLQLLSDPDLRRDMGRAARERILSMFTVEQSLAIFSDLYRQVTGMPTAAAVVERDQGLIKDDDGSLGVGVSAKQSWPTLSEVAAS